ncbi:MULTISPECIES: hypothetical protein [Arthrobacter]|uniref:DUF1453 domain-containing protein n=2 Tax=Arthrobacter TaxID=1663 RepID=A0ABU9KL41_9MICC|nr:hypothetical protein [Arthrobacter sp. YJM1]MDP5226257.1 hypothetical protein [Arthrobacter sp. YJM1]
MSLQMIGNVLLALALIGWIGYRQMTWRPVAISTMWRMPLIMGVVGVAMLMQTASPSALTPLDLGVLVAELVISLGIGAWMGALAHFRPLSAPRPVGRNGAMATLESRTGALGLLLWVLVIAVRVGLDVLASMAGSQVAASTGAILLMLAANRAARTFVFAQRIATPPSAAVQQPGARRPVA